MVRRVKAYLKSMKVITDEEELHRMSQEVEPPSGGLAPPPLPVLNTVKLQTGKKDCQYEILFQVRKRNPSPSPSAASSSSSTPSQYSHAEDKRLGQYLAAAPNKFGKIRSSCCSISLVKTQVEQVSLGSGAASPHAVKKLLSLSEQSSKPRQKTAPILEREAGSGGSQVGGGQGQPRTEVKPADPRADQPTPVNLTSESSSVTGRPKEAGGVKSQTKVKVRKMQNSIGSVTSTDSGYGQGFERLERQHSESPQLPPRRRYHQHYHRQQQHGKQLF